MITLGPLDEDNRSVYQIEAPFSHLARSSTTATMAKLIAKHAGQNQNPGGETASSRLMATKEGNLQMRNFRAGLGVFRCKNQARQHMDEKNYENKRNRTAHHNDVL